MSQVMTMPPTETSPRSLPFELIPTNLSGVFTSPAPPESFDARTANTPELLRYGVLLRRPKADDPSGVAAIWEKVFSRKWSPADRIIPLLKPQYGKTHVLRGVRKMTEGNFTSNNWSGGTIQGQWVTCFGGWTVPTVSQPPEAQGTEGGWNSSSWLGIDGAYGSNDVLQAGVEQRVNAQGNPSYVAWFEWFAPGNVGGVLNSISDHKVILGDTSPHSPSLASFDGNLYLAWKGDGNDNLNVMVSTDNGHDFGHKLISPEASTDTPALAVDGNNLFIAWKGSGNDNLNVAAVDINPAGIPTGLSGKVILGDTSPHRPALAALNGNLYLAWKGDGNDNLNVMVSTDGGHTFGHKFISPETSPQAPALAANNGSLFISWKGDGNDNLNVAVVDIDETTGFPTGFSNKVILGDTSPLPPTLAGVNGYLFLGWRGDGNDELNIMVSSNNGQSFGGKLISPETSTDAPVLASHNGQLFIGWKGDGNDNLNVSLVDMSGFTVPPYIFQTNLPNFTIRPGDTVYCSVQYINNKTAGQINFANNTTGQHFNLILQPPPGATFSGNSVEWIMEAPDGGEPVSSLPRFTPVNFTGSFGCGADGHTVGNPQTGDTWNVVNSSISPPKTLTSVTLGSGAVTINFIG